LPSIKGIFIESELLFLIKDCKLEAQQVYLLDNLLIDIDALGGHLKTDLVYIE